MSVLASSMVFLAAAVVAVPIFKRLKLGAILGYLVAGMVIGPAVMDWVSEPGTILHFAELGVVLLLFVIGLELEPEKLWKMRSEIVFTGGGQLLFCSLVIGLLTFYMLDTGWQTGLVIGLALALSSTAFAIQLMNEQGILRTAPGQKGFSVLLMQDLAVIPILLLVQALSQGHSADTPAWWISVLAIVAVLVVGKYLINPFLRIISHYGSSEIMTAAALLIVMATALGMQEAGLSMGMGAFVAGILLANSSFKHQLEMEIEPFKGLLLGLFFIAIGMNLDLQLLVNEPLFIFAAALLLVAIKTTIIFAILRLSKQSKTDSMRIALMLSQGGEFAFVVMGEAALTGLIEPTIASEITLIVGVSMALTSPLVILHSLWFNSRNCPPVYDSQRDTDEPRVLIAGFGRFGQITARILAANHISFTALDKDAEQIEFVRRFGNKIFYGDATRLDLLKVAGIEHAEILLIAVDSETESLKIVDLVSEHYPHIKMVVRARNRATVMQLAKYKNLEFTREMFASGIKAAKQVLTSYGFDKDQASKMCSMFEQHDEQLLQQVIDKNSDLSQMIEISKKGRTELETLFANDKKEIGR
ncbi:monovalent cation:proton antiporter-2 (CPA2) family protein [Aliiglaciecola litoralis]|uniref:Monovalent cation:proton antiporter-2 (CPA2) family protein n=1 Tax=Aliiglaciecola litoralis TaxID=582857 RepID=A0ABN1LHJ6_9ALTE